MHTQISRPGAFRAAMLGCCLMLAALTAQAASGPSAQLKATIDEILALLGNKSMESDARRAALAKLIEERFDFRAMSQMTLATNWKKASDADKEKFVGLFSQLLRESYMGRIEAYTDEKVSFVAEKIKGDKAMVDTRIATKTVEIPIDYKLVLNGDKWMVYDVVIEEVSLVRSYRTTYEDIVSKDGISGLLAKMEEKLAEMRGGAKTAAKAG